MGSFVPSNVSICGILNFSGMGKCSTPTMNGDSVCCIRASMETGARPFTASFMWLISSWMSLNLCSHDLSSLRSSLGGLVRIMLPGVASFSFSVCFSTRIEVFLFSGNRVLVFRACRVSWGRRICLVSCSNSFNKCWLVTRSASTSSVLACTVSKAPPGGRLSTSPGWSCILERLALLLLMFRVDIISL